MNAINHAATSLLIKNTPHVPIIPILILVQLIEVFWVVLNIVGPEFTQSKFLCAANSGGGGASDKLSLSVCPGNRGTYSAV